MAKKTPLAEDVISYLMEKGETVTTDVYIHGFNPKTVVGLMIRMAETGLINRRMVFAKCRYTWAYSATQSSDKRFFNNEPEYVYLLRNLPRHEEFV
jgi:hypothetical protein